MMDREGELVGKHILAGAPPVGKISTRAKARKLILIHIRENSNCLIEEVVEEINSGFNDEIIADRDLMKICS